MVLHLQSRLIINKFSLIHYIVKINLLISSLIDLYKTNRHLIKIRDTSLLTQIVFIIIDNSSGKMLRRPNNSYYLQQENLSDQFQGQCDFASKQMYQSQQSDGFEDYDSRQGICGGLGREPTQIHSGNQACNNNRVLSGSPNQQNIYYQQNTATRRRSNTFSAHSDNIQSTKMYTNSNLKHNSNQALKLEGQGYKICKREDDSHQIQTKYKDNSSKHLISFGNSYNDINNQLSSKISNQISNPYYRPNLSQERRNSNNITGVMAGGMDRIGDMNKATDKQNQEPNSVYQSNRSKDNAIKMPNKDSSNCLLLPMVNTAKISSIKSRPQANYHSNSLSEQSSISNLCQSSRLMTHENQVAFLKQKLIQTHSKLIRQLEMAKQLEDDFYQLKRKYDQCMMMAKRSNKVQQAERNRLIQVKQKEWGSQRQLYNVKVDQLTQQNIRVREEVDRLKTEAQRYLQREQQLIERQKQYQVKIRQNKYTSNDLKQILDSEQSTSNNQLQKHKQKNTQLKGDLQNMRSKVLSLIKQCQQKQQRIEQQMKWQQDTKQKLILSEIIMHKRQKQLTQKQQLCEIWRKKYLQSQQQFGRMQYTYFRYEKQLKQCRSLATELNVALRQQKEKNAQMLSQIISIQMENKETKNRLLSAKQQKQQLQDKLFQCTPQKNVMHQKLQLQQQLIKLTTEYNSLSAIINKKDKQINELKSQLLEKVNHIKSLQLQRQKEKQKEEVRLNRNHNKMNSVRQFVNRLQQEKQKSALVRRQQQQQIIRQNLNVNSAQVFNNNNGSERSMNSRSLSPISKGSNSGIIKDSNPFSVKTFNQNKVNNQMTSNSSKDLILISQNQHYNNNGQGAIQIYDNYEEDQQINHDNQTPNKNQEQQNNIANYQSYEDSLQKHNSQNSEDKTKSPKHISTLNNKPNQNIQKKQSNQNQNKHLTSYKQQKQQYLSLIQNVGDLEIQSYNLTVQKNKILDELYRIENLKVKTQEIISKRRQLQLWLLGNQKKNNQVKDKLKKTRDQIL